MMDRATIIEREKEREFGERYAFGSRERIGNSAGTLVNKSRAAKTGGGTGLRGRPFSPSFRSYLPSSLALLSISVAKTVGLLYKERRITVASL